MAEGTPPPPPKIEVNSPFYLGPQDKPGDFITPVRLNLDNFDDWAHAIRVALSSRRKFGFLDGTVKDIKPPATKDDWVTIHCMLVSWLNNTISPEVKSMLSNYDDARRLWEDLHERFSVTNGPRIQQLKAAINRCEQTKTMPVSIYFSKLQVLWDDLEKHEPLISCKCGKCTCNVGRQHAERRDKDRLQQFLLGLYSDHYAAVRSNLLSQDPLPTLNRAYQTVAQDERVRVITTHTEEKPDIVGFAVRMENHSKNCLSRAEKAALTCTHCHKSGHDHITCFEVHGVPDWYKEKHGNKDEYKGNPSNAAVRGKTPTTPVGSSSNVGRGRGSVQAHATSSTPSVNTPSTPSGPLPGFSAEQWQSLVAGFGTPKPPPNRLNGLMYEGGD